MLNRELVEYVESLGKKPGEYTREELIEIGIKHTKLLHDKSWPELAALLGVNKSGEQFRKWILKRRYELNIVPKNVKVLDNKTIDQITIADVSNTLTEQKAELFKEKQKVRDTFNAYRRGLREESRIEVFKELIENSTEKLNSLPSFEAVSTTKIENGKEAVLLLSDLHIGTECNNFYNTYNSTIAGKRLVALADSVVRYCINEKVSKLNICNLGDCVAGLIHVSARLEQEMETVDQVMTAAELIAQFLNKVSSELPEVEITYRSCSDNHSRIVADKNQHIEQDNLGRIIDWYLAARLAGTSIEFKNDNIDFEIGRFKLNNGKVVMFSHGHNDNINRSFENFVGATKEFVDYALLGHYHSHKVKDFQGFRVYVNGSIVGTEQYAFSKRLFSAPSQTLLVFDGNTVISHVIDLSINE